MTNPDPGHPAAVPAIGPDLAQLFADQAEQEAREAALRPSNKDALFEGLRLAGIAHVIVTFDGYGDSGQIDSIEARNAAGQSVTLPAAEVVFADIDWHTKEPLERRLTVEAAVEELVYGFLAETYGGWGNDDGAYGEFCFDAQAGTIHLDYNERFTSSEYFGHDF